MRTDLYAVDDHELERIAAEAAGQVIDEAEQLRDVAHQVRVAVWRAIQDDEFEPPRLPEMAMQVVQLAGDDEASAAQLGSLIKRDQFLAGAVLRAANSAWFGPGARRAPITKLPEAVVRLGMNRTRDVILSAATRQTVYRGRHGKLMRELWRAALGSALGCSLLATCKGIGGDQAFLLGLMHDVGKPVLAWELDKAIRSRFAGLARFEDLAEGVFHLMHAKVGATIIRQWNLPGAMSKLVSCHHDRQPPPELAASVAMLRLADLIYEVWCDRGDEICKAEHLLDHPLVRRLAIPRHAFAQALVAYPSILQAWVSE